MFSYEYVTLFKVKAKRTFQSKGSKISLLHDKPVDSVRPVSAQLHSTECKYCITFIFTGFVFQKALPLFNIYSYFEFSDFLLIWKKDARTQKNFC